MLHAYLLSLLPPVFSGEHELNVFLKVISKYFGKFEGKMDFEKA